MSMPEWATLKLPFGEAVYEVPSPPIDVALYLSDVVRLTTLVEAAGTADEVRDLRTKLESLKAPESMGENEYSAILSAPVYEKMLADRLPFEALRMATTVVGIWVTSNAQAALSVWGDDNGA